MTTTTTAPTAVDIERYVQLDALFDAFLSLRTDPSGELFDHSLVPDISLDGAHIVTERLIAGREESVKVSTPELFERIVPAGEEDSDRSKLTFARSMLLAARILRSITPQSIDERATSLEASAEMILFEVHVRDVA